LAALVVPGALVLGTSCVENLRESAVSGGLGFVEDAAVVVLEALIPVADIVSGGE
jgi:hypothetical protein